MPLDLLPPSRAVSMPSVPLLLSSSSSEALLPNPWPPCPSSRSLLLLPRPHPPQPLLLLLLPPLLPRRRTSQSLTILSRSPLLLPLPCPLLTPSMPLTEVLVERPTLSVGPSLLTLPAPGGLAVLLRAIPDTPLTQGPIPATLPRDIPLRATRAILLRPLAPTPDIPPTEQRQGATHLRVTPADPQADFLPRDILVPLQDTLLPPMVPFLPALLLASSPLQLFLPLLPRLLIHSLP